MSRGEIPLARSFAAAHEGRPKPPPAVPDQYWQDISGQAGARLAKLDDERTQYDAADEIRRPPRRRRWALMIAIGASLLVVVAYVLLKAAPLAALPP